MLTAPAQREFGGKPNAEDPAPRHPQAASTGGTPDRPPHSPGSRSAQTSSRSAETGLRCLVDVAGRHGVELTVDRLLHSYCLVETKIEPETLLRIAKSEGLKARQLKMGWRELVALREAYPAIALLTNGNWVEIIGADENGSAIHVVDPMATRPDPLIVPQEKFSALWTGTVLLVKRGRRTPLNAGSKFSFRWFIPELMREWRLFGDVAIAAVVLYALALVTPIFFQLVIDKVLVHESYSTLYVLAGGVCIALVFEAAFNFLRRYLLLFATNRTDIRVATKTFKHLLTLPISFFEQSSAGVLVKHMQQAGRIRDFLTGRLFLTLLDALSLVVFLPLLALYSWRLTLLVLAFTAAIGLVVAGLVGPFRKRLRQLYEVEADRQALLVETVHGMRTIKSLAMEPLQSRSWNNRSAESVAMRFRVEKMSAAAHAATGLLEKLMGVAIVGLGALEVFDGSMSIGALVAFNMLAGRVSGPLVQMVTMVHEYQEVALSVQMLGEIMNRKPEREGTAQGLQPALTGHIEFEGVGFRYGSEGAPALDNISFTVPAGSMLGIVGRSGSGKTTLTRLMQGLYPPQQGLIRIDDVDVRELCLVHLRRSIGVVLQDSFLFKGTVRDNIACVKPGATLDDVVTAARLAGATEFIERLPRGFDTLLEENAANLSGGQKQRLAIARALITNPPILIFDEATSALDPESERIIRDNLKNIAKGRTVIVISHRLSTLAGCDAILVIDRGRIDAIGRHEQLLTQCSTYRHLWNQQMKYSS